VKNKKIKKCQCGPNTLPYKLTPSPGKFSGALIMTISYPVVSEGKIFE
jgi:hypothetical protein